MYEDIAVSIIAKDNLFLLIRRKNKEGLLHWQFPSGKIEKGETDKLAAVREAFEETGINCQAEKKLGQRIHPNTQRNLHYWYCKYLNGVEEIKSKDEVDAVRWCSGKEAIELITSDIYLPVKIILENSIIHRN